MITKPWWPHIYNLIPSTDPGRSFYHEKVENLKKGQHDYTIKYCFKDKILGRRTDLSLKEKLVISGHSLEDRPFKVQVALVMTDGTAYGGSIELTKNHKNHILPLEELQEVKLALIPYAFPEMMPYWFDHPNAKPFNIAEIECVQISVGPGIPKSDHDKSHEFALESIWLE